MGIKKQLLSFLHRVPILRRNRGLHSPTLVSLAPNEKIEDNAHYVDLLEEQVDKHFDNSQNRNIALSGEYGTGKSSIIRKFKSNHEKSSVIISFATLNNAPSSDADGGDSIKRPAEDLPLYADSYGPEDRVEANGIQKEIVKQLMFRERSSALPHSKFHRVGVPNPRYSIALTIIILIVSAIFLHKQTEVLLSDIVNALNIKHVIVTNLFVGMICVGAIGCLYYVVMSTIGRLNLDKIKGGGISASFAESKNYFDDYLDEIIYLFEKKRYEIVIFEDLDRFDNVLIFERLRALNTALNSAEGMNGRVIRFIYAVRDSLFDNPAISNPGVSRAKFFDVIVPVVPFLTFENSLKHFRDNLPNTLEWMPTDNVLRIAARHITDMRLIYDICNEYRVFAERLNIKESTLGLKADNLFAMVVYKSICPKEFAMLKDHDNFLVDIVKKHSEERKRKIHILQTELHAKRSEISRSSAYQRKVGELTKSINALVEEIAQDDNSFNHTLLDDEGNSVDETYFDTGFWDKFQEKEDDGVVIQIRWTNNPYRQYSHVQKITKKFVENYIGETVALSELSKTATEAAKREIQALIQTINRLRFCSIQEHVQLESNSELGAGFSESLPGEESLLGEFIRAGFIDDYYLQYYSVYKGSLSRDALYYRHEFIERGEPDMRRHLEDDDIKELLSSLDDSYLSTPGMFNVDIVDCLVRNQQENVLQKVVSALVSDSVSAQRLMQAYQDSDKPKTSLKTLVGLLSKNGFKNIYDAITTLDDSNRLGLIDAAIGQASPDVRYELGDDAKEYLLSNLAKIDALKRQNKNPTVVHLVNAVNILIGLGERLDLRLLNNQARKMIIRSSLFKINEDNLNIAIGRDNFSLDKIRFEVEDGETLYQYLLNNLDEYINTLRSGRTTKHSLSGVRGFEKIINDVFATQNSSFEDFLELANLSDCIVEDINEIERDIWGYTFEKVMVQSSLQNLIDYYNHSKPEKDTAIDSHLIDYINSIDGDVWLDKDYDKYDQASRNGLLRSVIDSLSVSTSAKVNFIDALFRHRNKTINIEFFEQQNSDLYGALLAKGLLADTLESFERIRSLDWPTKLSYLTESSKAKDYLEGVLTIDELNNILTSDTLPNALRVMAMSSYKISDGELSSDAAQSYIELANKNAKSLGVDILVAVSDKVNAHDLIDAVNLLPEIITKAELKSIFMRSSDKQLQKIASSTRKRLLLAEEDNCRKLLDRLKAQNIIRGYRPNWRKTGLTAEIVE